MAQLVEQLLLTPENRSVDPVMGNSIYYQLYWEDENNEKEAGNGPIFFHSSFLSIPKVTDPSSMKLWVGSRNLHHRSYVDRTLQQHTPPPLVQYMGWKESRKVMISKKDLQKIYWNSYSDWRPIIYNWILHISLEVGHDFFCLKVGAVSDRPRLDHIQ